MTCPDRSDPHSNVPGGPAPAASAGPVRRGIAFLAAAALLVGCGQPAARPGPALTRHEFIDVVVAIRRAELDLERSVEDGDSVAARFHALRDSIMAAHGTTQEELYEFLEHHTDLEYMDAVWDSIKEGLKRPLRSQELPPESEEADVEGQRWPPTRPDDDGRGKRLRPDG